MTMSTEQVSRDFEIRAEVAPRPSARSVKNGSGYGQAGPVFLSSRVLSSAARALLSSPPTAERLTAYDALWYS